MYLGEDEVDEQVSTLKKAASREHGEDTTKGLGIEHGSFKWNEVPEEVEATKTAANGNGSNGHSEAEASNGGEDDTSTAVDSASVAVEEPEPERRFELADISVMFPEGELSVVTGPTASGKTALLVRSILSPAHSHSPAQRTNSALAPRWLSSAN